MPLDNKPILERIDAVLKVCSDNTTYQGAYTNDHQLFVLLSNTIEQLAPNSTSYLSSFQTIRTGAIQESAVYGLFVNSARIRALIELLKAIRFEYENGILGNLENVVYAQAFNDYLDMAEYFLNQPPTKGYVDTAAIIISCSLEQHIKRLCAKYGLPLTYEKGNGKTDYYDTNQLNQNLYSKKGAYDKRHHEYIKGWLVIRNDVTHGVWEKYSKADIQVMLMGVRNFISAYPC